MRSLLAVLVVGLVVYPLGALVVRPLGDVSGVLARIRAIPFIDGTLARTAILAVACLVLTTAAGTVLAWLLAQIRNPRVARVGFALAVSPIVIPPLPGIIGWTFALAPQNGYLNQLLRRLPLVSDEPPGPFNAYTLPWVILLTSLYLTPYVVLFVTTALRESRDLGESAARTSGASWLQAQRYVVLPRIRPALVYSSLIVLVLALGQFTAPLVLGRSERIDVLTTEMYRQTSTSPVDYDAAVMLAWPLLIAGLTLSVNSRRLVGNSTRYGSTGRGVARPSGRANSLLVLPVVAFFVTAVVPSLASLSIVSVSRFWSTRIDPSRWTLDNFRRLFGDASVIRAIETTVTASALGTACCITVAFFAALYLRHHTGVLPRIAEAAISIPLAVPAIIFGMGIFISYALQWPHLYGSRWALVVAYTVLLLPYGVRLFQSGLVEVGDDAIRAARTCGASAAKTTVLVVVPLLRRSVVAAALLMFILMSQEFGASVLLKTSDTETIATKLYSMFNFGVYADMASLSLVSVALTAVVVGLMLALGGRRALDSL